MKLSLFQILLVALLSITFGQTPVPTSTKTLTPTAPTTSKPTVAGTTKPTRLMSPSTPSVPVRPIPPVHKCLKIIQATCNCGLIVKGSDCPRVTAKTMCKMPRSRAVRAQWINAVNRRSRRWCKKLIRNNGVF